MAERIFIPERVKPMLIELQKQLKQAHSQEDEQLNHLKRQLKGNEQKTGHLYAAIEKGLPFGGDTQERLHKLKAERENLLIDISSIRRKRDMPLGKINKNQINQFCNALKTLLLEPKSGFGKGNVKLLVDEIRVEANQATMQGSYENLAYAVGQTQKKSNEAPFFMREWRPEGDSQ